ncbi:MAG: hypothetical protein ABL986_02285 [Vicinamibacterales bacterium]
MTEGQQEFLKILQAHRQTLDVCEACALTTRDLATEVVRGGLPKREDLERTVAEAERVLTDVVELRRELDRVLMELSEG